MGPLYFLHLPKTGGTSIRDAAKKAFGEDRTLMLYGRDRQTTTPAANAIWYERDDLTPRQRFKALSDHIRDHDIRFFSSHISAAELPSFDPERAFALFRPVPDQVLSSYVFKKSRGRTNESFEAFFEDPINHDVQARSFGRAEFDRVAQIGILEEFDAFVATLNDRFGIDFAVLHSNRRSLVNRLAGPKLDEATSERIRALNPHDVELYARAQARWRRDARS